MSGSASGSLGGLILAAGASKRLGHPKQLVRFGNETLLDRAVRTAKKAGCEPVVVVLGAYEELIRGQCKLHNVVTVSQPDWAEGMGTSLSLGVRVLEDVAGLLVMTCDMPVVASEHLRALAAQGTLTASSYSGRKGVPAYFPKELFSELLKIRGDAGARELLRTARSLELAGGELDVDTVEDLAQLRELVGDGRNLNGGR